jgi:hypothetical protein
MTDGAQEQLQLLDTRSRLRLERELAGRLERLALWTDAAEERTDWELEAVLSEVRQLAIELRALRNAEAIPF